MYRPLLPGSRQSATRVVMSVPVRSPVLPTVMSVDWNYYSEEVLIVAVGPPRMEFVALFPLNEAHSDLVCDSMDLNSLLPVLPVLQQRVYWYTPDTMSPLDL